MVERMDQDEVIKRFVAKYNACQKGVYEIASWPDKEAQNQQVSAIDAFCVADGEPPLAIEHTSVDTFERQREDNARIKRLFGELESSFSSIPYHLNLLIPTLAFPKGTKGKEKQIMSTISAWLSQNLADLKLGRRDYHLAGVPFPISIIREDDLSPGLLVGRWAPKDIDIAASFERALTHKYESLSKHRDELGATTILIVESIDISLTNHIHLYKAFFRAHRRVAVPKVEQVWLARTYDPEDSCWLFCFYGPQPICDKANPEHSMFGPKHASYWNNALVREETS